MPIFIKQDPAFVADMQRRIEENGGYCPCSVLHDDTTKCVCKEFREMEEGVCHCGLYIKTKEREL